MPAYREGRGPWTEYDERLLYSIHTPLSDLPELIERYLRSLGGNRWAHTNCADFWAGYQRAGYSLRSEPVLRRLASLHRNHFLRDADYEQFEAWLQSPENFGHPMYEDMLSAHRHRTESESLDYRPHERGEYIGLSLGGALLLVISAASLLGAL